MYRGRYPMKTELIQMMARKSFQSHLGTDLQVGLGKYELLLCQLQAHYVECSRNGARGAAGLRGDL